MRYSHLAFVLLAAGCRQHWEPPLEQPTPMKPSDAVLIWSNGTVEKWHGGGPHVRFGVGHSIRDIPGVRQLSTEHTLGAGGLDEGPPLDGRQNVTSGSGRRSRRPRCRVRSVFSCPRVDRRDVLVRRGFGGQLPNKRLKLPARVGY